MVGPNSSPEEMAKFLRPVQAKILEVPGDCIQVEMRGLTTHTAKRRRLSPVRVLHRLGLVLSARSDALKTDKGLRVAAVLRGETA